MDVIEDENVVFEEGQLVKFQVEQKVFRNEELWWKAKLYCSDFDGDDVFIMVKKPRKRQIEETDKIR